MGALTIKPIAYRARSWELQTIEILNFLDPFCSKITIQKRGEEIIRILPTRKTDFYWITDKMRFFFEGLKKQRIVFPYVFLKKTYIKLNWKTIIIYFLFLKYILDYLLENNKVEEQLRVKVINNYKAIFNNKIKADIISQKYLYNICIKNNLAIYEEKHIEGDRNKYYITENFLNEIKKNKIVIINNISIINDFPKIWLQIKTAKKFLIGVRETLGFFSIQIATTNKEIKKLEKNKSIISIIKKKSILLTSKKVQTKIEQIILTKNVEDFSTIWLDNKINFFKIGTEFLKINLKKNEKGEEKGINLTFQSHGININKGTNILLPITTFLEESSDYMDNRGEIQKSYPISIRKINMRSILQIAKAMLSIFLNIQEKSTQIKLTRALFLLKYGEISKKESIEYLKRFKKKTKIKNYIKEKIENVLFKTQERGQLNKKNNY